MLQTYSRSTVQFITGLIKQNYFDSNRKNYGKRLPIARHPPASGKTESL